MNAFVLDGSVSASWFRKDESNSVADRIRAPLKERVQRSGLALAILDERFESIFIAN